MLEARIDDVRAAGADRVLVVERRVGLREVRARVGAAALLAEEPVRADHPRERVLVVQKAAQPFRVANEPGRRPYQVARSRRRRSEPRD